MPRPRLLIGHTGKISVKELPRTGTSAPFLATAWMRRLDGKKVRVEARGTSASNARQNLIKRADQKKHEGTSNATELDASSTYAHVVLEYLQFERLDGRIRPQSVDRYDSIARKYLIPQLGDFLLPELSRSIVANFAHSLSPQTARECRKVFRNSWRWAQDENLIDRECPWGDIRLKANDVKTSQRASFASPDEIRELLALADEDSTFMSALFRTAVDTGMRIGELLGLSRADVDWDKGVVTVRATVSHQKGHGLVRGAPKTQSANRSLKVSDSTLSKLAELCRELDEIAQPSTDLNEVALISMDGNFNYPSSVEKRRRTMLAGTGLENIGFHTIRKTLATVVARETGNSESAAELMGHENVMVTGRHYYQRDSSPRDATGIMQNYLKR